ncbi:hypothetical protein ACH5RR_032278 [Cinchona calisaya]|uniref:Uncharacterized protein n=1 Tax=Cinchona calisaya TaxID=153742 RepID=A0ABD2YIZ6_9GENT
MNILTTKIILPSIGLNNGVGIAAVSLRHHSTALDVENIQHEAAIEAENQPVAAAFLPHHSAALDAENIQHEAAIKAENQHVAAAFLPHYSTALDAEIYNMWLLLRLKISMSSLHIWRKKLQQLLHL